MTEELKNSRDNVGEILPVVKDQHGTILDGVHRKEVNPNWKETTIEVTDELHALRIRVHTNVIRRSIKDEEKHNWIMQARKLLNPEDPMQPSQREIAKVLGMSKDWVWKYEKYHVDTIDMVKPFNIWNFAKCDERFGVDYKGRIPGQILQNCLYFFVPSRDAKILDPMAGSGTTFDVCREMGYNNCLCYDIKSREINKKRIEKNKAPCIIFNDICKGLPKEAHDAEFIFLDPYYYNMITNFNSLEQFRVFIQTLAERSKEALQNNGKVAILMADLTRDEVFIYLRAITHEIFKGYFGEPLAVISVPMTTEQADKKEILNARDSRKLLGRDRTLFVFEKVIT